MVSLHTDMNNPLLSQTDLPKFDQIKPEHIIPAVDTLLAEARTVINECLQGNKKYTWDNLITPIAIACDRLDKAWSPIGHLNAVANNDDLRAAYNECLPKLSAFSSEMGQNQKLFKAYQQIASSQQFSKFNTASRKIIANALRDFRLSGVDLPADDQHRFRQIDQQLASLASKFSDNILDATAAWGKHITCADILAGLPDECKAIAKQTAQQQGKDGWQLTLQMPCYMAVMTYADNRDLRQEMYLAYNSRAASGKWDNGKTMEQILALKHEKAQLLGFANYAALSLADKMAKTVPTVDEFLQDLANRCWRRARADFAALGEFANRRYSIASLRAFDIAYFSEKMRQHRYQISQQQLKEYFPAPKVLAGLFAIAGKLYGIKITPIEEFSSWHESVQMFAITDANGQLRGRFYLDLYAREHKRGGAWMDDCIGRHRTPDHLQTPVAYLTCNFAPAPNGAPALLTHEEVLTLFHEFGHGLQHLLTQVDYCQVAGINGVQWDAVELPSQFMENWCWQPASIKLISSHYQTGEALPDAMLDKMLAAKNFQSAMFMVRQLEFALFDFAIHQQPCKVKQIYQTIQGIRQQIAPYQVPPSNRIAHSFSHIFSGGYAAGYYSYLWAEVLASDAFCVFEERGIFSQECGAKFLHTVLEQGGSRDAMDIFVDFRGKQPDISALLRHKGISDEI